jgi:hypothetical protein
MKEREGRPAVKSRSAPAHIFGKLGGSTVDVVSDGRDRVVRRREAPSASAAAERSRMKEREGRPAVKSRSAPAHLFGKLGGSTVDVVGVGRDGDVRRQEAPSASASAERSRMKEREGRPAVMSRSAPPHLYGKLGGNTVDVFGGGRDGDVGWREAPSASASAERSRKKEREGRPAVKSRSAPLLSLEKLRQRAGRETGGEESLGSPPFLGEAPAACWKGYQR